MPYDPHKHHRRSIRLQGYDYTTAGGYFVTICVHGRQPLLGDIIDGAMVPSPSGQLAADAWRWLAERYPYVLLDAWTLMPNHMHGIIVLAEGPASETTNHGRGDASRRVSRRGASRGAPTSGDTPKRKTLGSLIGAFKTVSTKAINQQQGTPGARFWQRNYYERIIRNGREFQAIRDYIHANPANWATDQLHPDAPPAQNDQPSM